MSQLTVRLSALLEGVGIALESLRSNRVRAALTILGVAIGVFVVVLISAAIHGINASVAKDFEKTGPTTFFLSRFPITFEACDGSDDTCKWRHNPKLSINDVRSLGTLSTVRAAAGAAWAEPRGALQGPRTSSTQVIGFSRQPGRSIWTTSAISIRPDFTESKRRMGRVVIINDEMATCTTVRGVGPVGQGHLDRWCAVSGDRRLSLRGKLPDRRQPSRRSCRSRRRSVP